jgi:Bacterial Ig-like domain (group 3)/FG-GAP-like repeat
MSAPVRRSLSLSKLVAHLVFVLGCFLLLSASGCPPWWSRVHHVPPGTTADSEVLNQPHSLTQFLTRTSIIRPAGSAPGSPSEPALAPFFGNLTAVISAPADSVGLLRQPDCSLTYYDFGLSASLSAIDLTNNSQVPNYEKTIHSNAFLTATPDVFSAGCVDNTLGVESQRVLGLGPGKNGQRLFAVISDSDDVYTGGLSTALVPTTPVAQATPLPPLAILTADLNKDGNPDLVSLNTDGLSASITVFLGKADGSYQPGVSYVLPGNAVNFGVIADMDHDGNLDVVIGAATNPFEFYILYGNGTGALVPGTPVTAAANAPISFSDAFIAADINGDGFNDLISARGAVFINNQNGSFTQAAQPAFSANNSGPDAPSIVAADFNKDGKIDLATDDGLTIRTYLNAGSGAFTVGPAYAAIPNSAYLIATDVDGDGNIDLLTGYGSNGAYGGDGLTPNEIYALMGNGDGTFQGAPALPTPFIASNLADLNGDGRLDLVAPGSIIVAGVSQSVFNTSLGQADGKFVAGPQLVLPPYIGGLGGVSVYPVTVESFVVGDFNGDHIPDLLFNPGASIPVAGYYLALGNGDGSFQTPTFIPAPTFEAPGDLDINEALASFVVADFNHDGKLDIAYNFFDISFLTGNYTEGLAVQLGNGNGSFQAPQVSTTYSGLTQPTQAFGGDIAGIGDVNKDGFPDVFLLVSGPVVNFIPTNTEELFISNGDGSFKPPVAVTLTGNMRPLASSLNEGFPIAFADLNGDGKIDLIAGGSSLDGTTPELAIALGNGNGTFQAPTILNIEGFGFVGAPTVADFDGDGKLDVYADGIFYGNGDGTLKTIANGDSTVSAPGNIALSLLGPSVAADLNGDNKPDLIVGNVVLLNINGEVAPPPALAPTTTTLTSSANPSTSGQSVTFTATVTSTAPGTPTGSVTFLDNNVSLGSAVTLNGSAVATFATSSLSAASHPITALYNGDATFAVSPSNTVTQVVNAADKAATTTTVGSSQNPSTSGQSVTFTATVSSQTAGTPTGSATFFDGNTALGSAVTLNGSSAATLTTSSLSAASHSITAQYSGDATFASSTSNTVTQQVNAAANGDFSVSVTPTTLNLTAGQSGSVALTITPVNGSTQTINFNCSGLPEESGCTFTPPSVTLDGTHNGTSTLTIQTQGRREIASLATDPSRPSPANFALANLGASAIKTLSILAALAMLLVPVAVCIFAAFPSLYAPSSFRAVSLWIAALALLTFALAACAGNNDRDVTPAGSYSVTVTLSANGSTHTVPITLNVKH